VAWEEPRRGVGDPRDDNGEEGALEKRCVALQGREKLLNE
jgi:hypothetical protein